MLAVVTATTCLSGSVSCESGWFVDTHDEPVNSNGSLFVCRRRGPESTPIVCLGPQCPTSPRRTSIRPVT